MKPSPKYIGVCVEPKSDADKAVSRFFLALGVILVIAFAWFVFR